MSNMKRNAYFDANKENYQSDGWKQAYYAWLFSKSEDVELDRFLMDRDVHDFVCALRDAGFSSFIVTDRSRYLIDNIHSFVQYGCHMDGVCNIEKDNGIGIKYKVKGLRIRLN